MPRKSADLVSKFPTCPECGLEFDSKKELDVHTVFCNVEPANGFYCCEKAGCRFKTKFMQSLRTHIACIHIKSKSYRCELCDYKTVWPVALTGHYENKHNGEGLEAWLISYEVQKLRQRRERKAQKSSPLLGGSARPKRRYRRRSQRNSLGESVHSDSSVELTAMETVVFPEPVDSDEHEVEDEPGFVSVSSESLWMECRVHAQPPVRIEHDYIMEAMDFDSFKLML